MKRDKPFEIPKELVSRAYVLVKKKGGGPGADGVTIEDFEKDLKNNLYKIWNRLSSGCYFPPPVLGVEIPKKGKGTRILGIPTVGDRVAQMAIRLVMEEHLEPIFDEDSYGYRPKKSAHDAIGVTRRRCWKQDWVLEFDIKKMFDTIPHDLLMKAVRHHIKEKWAILAVERWLKSPMVRDGVETERKEGTPQGGVVSPLLANLFMHYAFDAWMRREFPGLKFCRYADDGLVHCDNEQQALGLKDRLAKRFKECGLEMHPEKTRIVYCRDSNRRESHRNISFDFLGFTFRPRCAANNRGKSFTNFLPAVSKSSLKSMGRELRRRRIHRRTQHKLEDLAKELNPMIRGWVNYYSKFYKTAMYRFLMRINWFLWKWFRKKYKKLGRRKALQLFDRETRERKNLFWHWKLITHVRMVR